MSTHDFYIALAYGVSACLLVAEVVLLYARWYQARTSTQAQHRDSL
jgi:hypothetical protein